MAIPSWLLIPFLLMLLCIALLPALVGKWWDSNKNKLIVSLVLGVPTSIILMKMGLQDNLKHQMLYDYIPFIVLLLTLFTITGRIHLSGSISPTPKVNTLFMAIGAVLASFMGTTGAAMLLIRPLLNANKNRQHKVHTVLFFIAVVANCGGLLTPLGDPPLFLLYLRGAEFTWFFHMFPEWLMVNVVLLGIYFVLDTMRYKKDNMVTKEVTKEREPLRIQGAINFLWLFGVVMTVAFINEQYIPQMGEEHASFFFKFLREFVFLGFIILSIALTPKHVAKLNDFSWSPILEVAILFLGIFITMTPALLFLQQNASSIGLSNPIGFYFATGVLSSFLDNAPTALSFYAVAQGLPESLPVMQQLPLVAGIPEVLLTAISMGSVFFGAMTYIGNGPNFMVKAIAESNGVRMPGFVPYMYRFSIIILLPLFGLVAVIFLL